MRTRSRRGWTFIELLTVMVVLGILSTLAVLRYIDLRHRATAVRVASELKTVQLAAFNHWAETGTWAASAPAGTTPPQLTPFLPSGFSFSKPEYDFQWENFIPPGGGPSGGMQLGIVVTPSDSRLMTALRQVLGNAAPFAVTGTTLTYIIIGPDGLI